MSNGQQTPLPQTQQQQQQVAIAQHDISSGRPITYFDVSGKPAGVTSSGGTFYSVGANEDMLFRTAQEAQQFAASRGQTGQQVGVSNVPSSDYWRMKESEQMAAKREFGAHDVRQPISAKILSEMGYLDTTIEKRVPQFIEQRPGEIGQVRIGEIVQLPGKKLVGTPTGTEIYTTIPETTAPKFYDRSAEINRQLGLGVLNAPKGKPIDVSGFPVIAVKPARPYIEPTKYTTQPLYDFTKDISKRGEEYADKLFNPTGSMFTPLGAAKESARITTRFITSAPEFFATIPYGYEMIARDIYGGKGKEVPGKIITGAGLMALSLGTGIKEKPIETLGTLAIQGALLGKIPIPKAPKLPSVGKISFPEIEAPGFISRMGRTRLTAEDVFKPPTKTSYYEYGLTLGETREALPRIITTKEYLKPQVRSVLTESIEQFRGDVEKSLASTYKTSTEAIRYSTVEVLKEPRIKAISDFKPPARTTYYEYGVKEFIGESSPKGTEPRIKVIKEPFYKPTSVFEAFGDIKTPKISEVLNPKQLAQIKLKPLETKLQPRTTFYEYGVKEFLGEPVERLPQITQVKERLQPDITNILKESTANLKEDIKKGAKELYYERRFGRIEPFKPTIETTSPLDILTTKKVSPKLTTAQENIIKFAEQAKEAGLALSPKQRLALFKQQQRIAQQGGKIISIKPATEVKPSRMQRGEALKKQWAKQEANIQKEIKKGSQVTKQGQIIKQTQKEEKNVFKLSPNRYILSALAVGTRLTPKTAYERIQEQYITPATTEMIRTGQRELSREMTRTVSKDITKEMTKSASALAQPQAFKSVSMERTAEAQAERQIERQLERQIEMPKERLKLFPGFDQYPLKGRKKGRKPRYSRFLKLYSVGPASNILRSFGIKQPKRKIKSKPNHRKKRKM